ncbi:ABC transporter permease [Schaalia suimastitidis]|uniref:ABC transporter permease n=1 Tax=Schaalia suimastitidis TaxID=121163 RepID=UPI000411DE37|nr:ABC transporter permease [Schaalia suimastitidis]
MTFLTRIVGPLVEAWGEVKVQKARVILSLVGVVAAVAALATVIALGDLQVQAQKEMNESYEGRSVTLHIQASKSSGDTNAEPMIMGGMATENGHIVTYSGPMPSTSESATEGELTAVDTGSINDPVGSAMASVAQRYAIPYWSRKVTVPTEFKEVLQAQSTGTFREKPIELPESGSVHPEVMAVDPAYQVIYRLKVLSGRWLEPGDEQHRITPVVINDVMWKALARPDINDPVVLSTNEDIPRMYRVVGVVKSKTHWDPPQVIMSYAAWQYTRTDQSPTAEMLVWAGPEQVDEARRLLPLSIAAVLGQGWSAEAWGGETTDGFEAQMDATQKVIMVIGGIVIFLGALGLLNVAIVTVKQRMREIGIRRAMGASASRVFFAVFMESVVATFVAGVLGVAFAVVILRYLPLESILAVVLEETPSFPMRAALAGVGISVGIGALCGIIPAISAVRVKPIDAIRS